MSQQHSLRKRVHQIAQYIQRVRKERCSFLYHVQSDAGVVNDAITKEENYLYLKIIFNFKSYLGETKTKSILAVLLAAILTVVEVEWNTKSNIGLRIS